MTNWFGISRYMAVRLKRRITNTDPIILRIASSYFERAKLQKSPFISAQF
jgi:hypothetical protein